MCTHSLHSDRYIDCFGIGYQIKEMKKKVVYLWRSGSPAHAAGHDKSSQPVNSITRASDPPDLVFGFFPLPDGMDPPPRSVDAASHRTDLIFFVSRRIIGTVRASVMGFVWDVCSLITHVLRSYFVFCLAWTSFIKYVYSNVYFVLLFEKKIEETLSNPLWLFYKPVSLDR